MIENTTERREYSSRRLLFWGGFCALLFVFIAVFKSALLPFVVGFAVAYLLNPAVNLLGRWRISRSVSALLILVAFIIVVGGILAALAPVAYSELQDLSKNMPQYWERFLSFIDPWTKNFLAILGQKVENPDSFDLKSLLSGNSDSAINVANYVLGGLVAGGAAFANFLSLMVIAPVAAFFVLKEWPRISNWVVDLLPRESEKTIMDMLKEIDKKLSGFVRGQISVAAILGIVYAVTLSLMGLKYGFLIGLGAGILNVIPLVGSTAGLLVGTGVAWFQSGELGYTAMIAGVFIAGQLMEGNFLTPKIVGNSVGLHPLWIFFALIAGGSVFGILGMLLAVPVAAVVSVLAAFAIHKYKQSEYYKGKKSKAQASPAKKGKP